MKKSLFSLAFIAVSGVYVAAANHLIGLPTAPAPATTADVAVPTTTLVPSPDPKPSAFVAPLVTPPPPRDAPLVVAEASSVPATPLPSAGIDLSASFPPLPRPRPADPTPKASEIPASTADAGTGGGYRDGIYTGGDDNAYYGRVQVQVTVTNRQIAAVKVLDYPQDRRTSRYINSQALPALQREVIAADSGDIDAISGATLTSNAYIRSLGEALAKAIASNA